MGAMPRDYPVIRAARYLGVPPWDLEGRPVFWMFRGIAYERAELRAEEDRAKDRPK